MANQPQNWQAWFNSLTQGRTPSLKELEALKPEMDAAGVSLAYNAAGNSADIVLPNGQIVDVMLNATSPGGPTGWAWQPDAPGGGGGFGGTPVSFGAGGFEMGTYTGGGMYPLASVMGPGLMQPWTTPFNAPPAFSGAAYNFAPPPDFSAPNVVDDPGYKFRLAEGNRAVEGSAAAKGTLLSGGTLRDLQDYAQGLASTEYGNAWNRGFQANRDTYGRRFGENQMAYGRAFNENNQAYNRAMGEYLNAYNIYNANQTNQFNRLHSLSSMGLNAAGQTGNAASSYATSGGDIMTQVGNANAAGRVGQANAYGSMLESAGSMWPDSWSFGG